MTAAASVLPVRVKVQDVWDEVPVELPGSTTVAELKRQALRAVRVQRSPDEYVLKYRGAQVLDESRSLEDAGIVPNAGLVLLPRRRRPIRA